ncbi:Panacea domain-containing protein [Peribacillus simplex]|uniref:Panacea domain-containing protein n=1 Tax=Peribacillus simplex TaxID=1478 RepID=UPI003336F9C7
MTHNVIDVSKWFIQNNTDACKPSFNGHIKLQKLLYYSQALSLAVNDSVLFDNQIQAWENGPVVSEVFREYRHNDLVENTFEKTEFDYAGIFDDKTHKILEIVNYIYGFQTGDQLIELTHSEEPWKELEAEAKARRNPEIKVQKMKDYYSTSLKEVFELYEDYDLSSDTREEFNGNVFVYNSTETTLTDEDVRALWEIGENVQGEKYFVYMDEDNEMVVF